MKNNIIGKTVRILEKFIVHKVFLLVSTSLAYVTNYYQGILKINNFRYQIIENKIFNEIKAKSIEVWKTYDNQFGYIDEKVTRINSITNFKDNCTFIVAMFDMQNQNKLLNLVGDETKEWLSEVLEYSRKN